VRFNDVHKQLCAALSLDEEDSRKYRTFMLRHFSRARSPNAILALLRVQIAEDRAKAQAPAEPA
jgi:hypothetical protein